MSFAFGQEETPDAIHVPEVQAILRTSESVWRDPVKLRPAARADE
jgi:hypothetical protein